MNQNTNPREPLSPVHNLSSFILHSTSPNYSTTRLLVRPFDEIVEFDKEGKIKEECKFTINHPKLNIQHSKFIGKPEDKFETLLFLPPSEGRQGEGGLRTKGYFKFSYENLMINDECLILNDEHGNSFKLEKPSLDILNSTLNIKKLPLISVITVVYNGAKYLEETIKSVINQTYPNVEYIIIDGGSTDGTLDIIKKYEDYIDYWVSEKDNGQSDALNKGFSIATGDIFFYLASDDILLPGVLKKIAKIFQEEDIDFLYGNRLIIDANDNVLSERRCVRYLPYLSKIGLLTEEAFLNVLEDLT